MAACRAALCALLLAQCARATGAEPEDGKGTMTCALADAVADGSSGVCEEVDAGALLQARLQARPIALEELGGAVAVAASAEQRPVWLYKRPRSGRNRFGFGCGDCTQGIFDDLSGLQRTRGGQFNGRGLEVFVRRIQARVDRGIWQFRYYFTDGRTMVDGSMELDFNRAEGNRRKGDLAKNDVIQTLDNPITKVQWWTQDNVVWGIRFIQDSKSTGHRRRYTSFGNRRGTKHETDSSDLPTGTYVKGFSGTANADDGLTSLGVIASTQGFGRPIIKRGSVIITEFIPISRGIWGAFRSVARTFRNVVRTVGRVAARVGEAFLDAAKVVSDFIGRIPQLLEAAANRLAQGIQNAYERVRDAIKDFVSCLSNQNLVMLPFCDPERSDISIGSGPTLSATCGGFLRQEGELGRCFRLTTESGGAWSRADSLPGLYSEGPAQGPAMSRDMPRMPLRDMMTGSPSTVCGGRLSAAFMAEAEFEPTLTLEVDLTGNVVISVEAMASVMLEALIEAEGSCGWSAERRFPQVPKTKLACAGVFCVMVGVQAVAELSVSGTLTGAVAASVAADVTIRSTIRAEILSGRITQDSQSPEISRHAGLDAMASADATIRFGVGPHILIWVIPGPPVDLLTMVVTEVRGQGTFEYFTQASSSGLEERSCGEDREDGGCQGQQSLYGCAAVGLNILAELTVSGLGLPEPFLRALELPELIAQAVESAAESLTMLFTGKLECVGPPFNFAADAVQTVTTAAARVAGDLISSIPGLENVLNFASGFAQTFGESPRRLFCSPIVGAGYPEQCGNVGCSA